MEMGCPLRKNRFLFLSIILLGSDSLPSHLTRHNKLYISQYKNCEKSMEDHDTTEKSMV